MKILHTSDWHFGIELHKMPLLEDQKFFLEQLKSIIRTERSDVVIISGDIYDTSLATQDAIALFDQAVHMLCRELQQQVVVIAGNHDSPTRLSQFSSLLGEAGLHIYGKLENKVKPLRIQDTLLYPIPYFHLDTVQRIYGVPIRSSDEAISVIVNDAMKDHDPKLCHIAIAHIFASGASLSESDRFASIGGSDMVSAEVFQAFDYTALGHLHRAQHLPYHVCYSGSPIPYSFSEATYKKSVSIFDTETKQIRQVTYPLLHELRTIKGTYEEVHEMIAEDEHKEDYIRIELSDTWISYELLQYFRGFYPNLLQLNGKQILKEQTNSSIELKDIDMLKDEEIVQQFFLDYFDTDISDDELKLLQQAKEKIEEHEYEANPA